ncbi:Protein rogdi [Armadillidium nasatum]|uniref:Protein rogdi n=1 Tax=Armadillidium nasatum TaxID=96803 RepID=A0A5N5T014_9CRUS|nr:Protein rogdi [Armadillidium nasatum]KAB7506619.1 Protein rogdi [Armadillidium nasatum]
MVENERAELVVLQHEFDWLLTEEVPRTFNQVMQILKDCCTHFPVPLCGHDAAAKQEKYIMSTPSHTTQDQVKCVVTVNGDTISQADMSLKIAKHANQIHRTSVTPEAPWRIQQIQDAANFIQLAIKFLDGHGANNTFKTSGEVLSVLTHLTSLLQKGRSSLLIPRKKTIDELMNSRNMLVLAVYHLSNAAGTVKFDSIQAECAVPWLNPVLVSFTTALHIAHQLRDKVSVFSQYKDFTPDSCSVSTVSC